jgi:dTDP-4-dehydrorhamnose 3,5-epimerase
MIFTPTSIEGVFIIEPELREDERGFFALTWSAQEFAEHGLCSRLSECYLSLNRKKGTLRGMHYQLPPYAQVKLVNCLVGSIYDVIIDLRRDSPTFTKWLAVELSSSNRLMLYVPEGLAHGFQTLEDHTEVFYQMSEIYAPDHARGVRWDDASFDITWPPAERTIIARDRDFPDFDV